MAVEVVRGKIMDKAKVKQWADGKAKECIQKMRQNYDDPDKGLKSLYVNGYHAAMVDLLLLLDSVDDAKWEVVDKER